MKLKKLFAVFLRTAALMVFILALLYMCLMLNMLYPINKSDIAPGSVWVMVVDKEIRQMPRPAGAELLSYATKGNGVHLLGYDAAKYKWTQNPTDFEEWAGYWKKLGYVQISDERSTCMRSGLRAIFTKKYHSIEICHDPETMTSWIEKTP